MSDVGLRGRGGGGTRPAQVARLRERRGASARYVVANGFEADPGAQVDRTLMERDPHAVVEGVALAAYAVGAEDASSSPCARGRDGRRAAARRDRRGRGARVPGRRAVR